MIVPTAQAVTTIAALHMQGANAHVLIAGVPGDRASAPDSADPASTGSGSGSGSGGGGGGAAAPTLAGPFPGLRAMDFPSADTRAIADALEAAGVQVLIRILPGAQTIIKPATLPPVEVEESAEPGRTSRALLDALQIISETDLPATLPAYRRSVGVIRPGGTRFPGRAGAGLLTGWPAVTSQPAPHRGPWPCPEVWIAEAAALAVLAQAVGGCEQAVYLDRELGAGSIIDSGPARTIARVFRIPSEDRAAQNQVISRTLAETAKAAGLDRPLSVPDSVRAVELDPAPAGPPIPAQLRDARWRSTCGLAYAALVAYTSPDPAISSLVNLHEREPKAKPPVWERAVRWFGDPARAVATLVLCFIVVLALPFGVAYARYNDLKKLTGGQEAIITHTADAEKLVAFYKLLRDKRWPMTKLLGDIASAAPVGVTFDSLELAQADGAVTIRGSAESANRVTTFREHLSKTLIFTQVATPTIATGSTSGSGEKDAGVQFTLNAKIATPSAMFPAAAVDDFAKNPLVDRLYGPGSSRRASESAASRPSRSGSSSTRPDRNDRRNSNTRTSTPAARTPDSTASASRPSASAPAVAPKPIDAEQIAKLDFNGTLKEWTQRQKASREPGVDDATKQRLADEIEKIKARMNELKQQMSTTPPAGSSGSSPGGAK